MGSPNAITNGFEFQYASAIYIFLKYAREIQKIGLETGEDIEAILKNDQRIFAQAKSSNDGNALHIDDHTSTVVNSKLIFEKIKKSIMLVNAYANRKLTENVCRLAVADKKIDAFCREHPKRHS